MPDSFSHSPRRRKGRPASPYQIERLAIATHLVNQGCSFSAAADAGVTFLKLAADKKTHILDEEANASMPQKKARRRIALYELRNRIISSAERDGEPIPLAFRIDRALHPGRPKKNRRR